MILLFTIVAISGCIGIYKEKKIITFLAKKEHIEQHAVGLVASHDLADLGDISSRQSLGS
jgi:hypothetical protein